MKNKLYILAILLCTYTNAQFKKVSLEGGFGGSLIADQCAVLDDNYNHYNLTLRYNLTPTFGIGLYGSHDNLSFTNTVDVDYKRLTFEGVANLNRVLRVSNNRLVFLTHGGVGASWFTNPDFNTEHMLALSGGLTGLLRLNNWLVLKADVSTTANINQENTLNFEHATTNRGVNSFVYNFSAGLAFQLGKRGERHADWYKEPVVVDSTVLEPVIIDRTITVNKLVENSYNCSSNEYVYFDFDDTYVNRSELAAIESAIEKAREDKTINLTGWSCPRFGSTEYNYELAGKRVESVKSILMGVGFPESRITVNIVGKDVDRGLEEARAMARRVELKID